MEHGQTTRHNVSARALRSSLRLVARYFYAPDEARLRELDRRERRLAELPRREWLWRLFYPPVFKLFELRLRSDRRSLAERALRRVARTTRVYERATR